jgi:hypothetical protein
LAIVVAYIGKGLVRRHARLRVAEIGGDEKGEQDDN